MGVTILAIILFVIFSFLGGQPTKPQDPGTILPTKNPESSRDFENKVVAPMHYDTQKTEELVSAAKNRKALSENGIATKLRLTTSLNGASGRIYASPTVSIEYIKSPDLFQGEINSTSIMLAKQEAVNWMVSQGFTKEDICKLPFSFYLSSFVRNSSEGSSEIFNPLPEGC